MSFPSELPAMRRQIVPVPHPLALTLAWGGLAYAAACALLSAPLPPALSADPLWLADGSGGRGAGALGGPVLAVLVPTLILALLARRATPVWPAARMAAAYVAMIGVVATLQLSGNTRAAPSLAYDCCTLSRL
jgi:hypothetical protein